MRRAEDRQRAAIWQMLHTAPGSLDSNHQGPDPKTWEALEKLPAELAREINFAARVYDACDLLEHYRRALPYRGPEAATQWLTASIHALDEQDVRSFGAKFRARYKRPLPHLAADATVLRFVPSAGTRTWRWRPPREVRGAWQASERLMPKEVA